MRVCGLEFTSKTVDHINQHLNQMPMISRRGLARFVCQRMEWNSASGRYKEAACRKALVFLAKEGIITLAEYQGNNGHNGSSKDKRNKCIEAVRIACRLKDLGTIELEGVTHCHSKTAGIWSEMMARYHYLGGALCGAQLRYLIRSSNYGYIGALGFSSSTWMMKCRDDFIGWTEKARRSHIQQVICNSRFLILPEVQVPNLASHVLGQCARRVGDDWQSRYGIKPVLIETFVDPKRFKASSYRAANWIYVGQTSGRRAAQQGQQAKDIFLYPLCSKWQQVLCEEPQYKLGQRPQGGDYADWAEEEFGAAELYDPRLSRRLNGLARDFYNKPQSPITQACGSHAKTVAAYRFFNNERVTMENLLRAHTESSIGRIREHKVVLAVQDTTTLNYTTHHATEGLGPIATSSKSSVGLVVHDTMAFTADGTPLGLLDVQCWARDRQDVGKKHRRKYLPIEQKESVKWLKSYRTVCQVQQACPETMLISVGDRESDIYELFLEAVSKPDNPKLLVRSERSRNRKTQEAYLWDEAAIQQVAGHQVIHVPRKGCQLAREAVLEVRYAKVILTPPQGKDYPPVEIWMVYGRETDYPQSVTSPLEWMLLTTVDVNSFEDACQRLAWYAKRWGIEIFHRTLKSGCKIEDRQLGTAESLQSCLAIDMVVAWRIYHLTKLGREVPDAPCSIFFEEAEWKALYIFINKTMPSPDQEPTLREAIHMTASLGGFLGRKSDGEPGTTTLWRGLQRLEDITATYLALLPLMKSGP